MLKGLGNLASLMKQAQEMQGQMEQLQVNLGRLKVEGSAGGGMVTVQVNGQQKVLSVTLDESLIESNDREMLEELLVAATNQALDKAKQSASEEMSKLAGGIDLPGLGEALSKLGLGGNVAN